ncbi:MAG: PLDc N-terminal domain-containing protein [Campylobacterales bacterium]|nr:PLDc N-terminal domain-containing protein [Campylobacterales bacterium]
MPGGFEWLFMMVIVLGSIGLFIYILVDILKSEFTNSINKVIWLILVLFTGPLGIVLYLLIGKKQRIKK